MIILPRQPRVLMPVPARQWRESSLSQTKDQFGRQNRTVFWMRAWKRDGGLVDEQRYDDRDEFDYALWRHIVEEPHADIYWEWASSTALTSPTGSNQTYNVPSDWNNANNKIECLGAGGGGGASRTTVQRASGGGAGGYGYDDNITLTPGGTATYQIGTGGPGGTTPSSNAGQNGTTGGDTWFNGTTYAGAPVGGLGGIGGIFSSGNPLTGSLGGAGKGDGTFTGGRAGNHNFVGDTNRHASGGGGAAGPGGDGGNAPDSVVNAATATDGGASSGGAAGGAGSVSTAGPGTSSTEFQGGVAGSGSGGGGSLSNNTPRSGAGGAYGGGAGGHAAQTANVTAASGAQGVIVVTYTPAAKALPPRYKPLRFYRRAA